MTRKFITDQIRGSTQRERFLKLQKELRTFSEGANSQEYETVLYRFLSEFERLRLETETQILKLHKEISFCEGTMHACATVANTLVSVIKRYREELKRDPVEEPAAQEKPTEKPAPPTDTEVLKTICVCGCQDAEDAADCNCSCHKGIPCDDENCVVCQTKKKELAQAPRKQKKKKSAPRKKKTQKKTKGVKKTAKKEKA